MIQFPICPTKLKQFMFKRSLITGSNVGQARKLPTNLSVAFSSCTISDQHGNGSNKGGGQHCLISLASVQLLLSLLQVKYWEGAGVLGRPHWFNCCCCCCCGGGCCACM